MYLPLLAALVFGFTEYLIVTRATAAEETRNFFAIKATCTKASPLPTLSATSTDILYEVRGWTQTTHEACATVVDAPLLPGDRPRARQKCNTYDLVSFSVMCHGGPVSAARWWAATTDGRQNDVSIDGDELLIALRGHSGWGGTPSRGITGLTVARGGQGLIRLPPGFGFAPKTRQVSIALPWQDMASGRALQVVGSISPVPDQVALAPGWVRALAAGWPWLQLVLIAAIIAFAVVAFFGLADDPAPFVRWVVLCVISLAGILASARPATLPDAALARARASVHAAELQQQQADRDRTTMRSIVRISSTTGYLEPVSADDLLRAKGLIGTRVITSDTTVQSSPGFWAAAFLLPSVLFVVLHIVPFLRGRHYLFVAHPAAPVVADPLRRGELFPAPKLGQALRPNPVHVEAPPPAYQSRNLLEKARALKDRITADADIAEAAMRRDRARAQQLEAEAELRRARQKLPWWRRWLIR